MNLGYPNKDLDGTSKSMTVSRDKPVMSINKLQLKIVVHLA